MRGGYGERGQLQNDGVINYVGEDYSSALAHAGQAKNQTLIYKGAPDNVNPAQAPFFGNIGIFVSSGAIAYPDGPWFPDYQGSFPVSAQPHILAPEPWHDPDIR